MTTAKRRTGLAMTMPGGLALGSAAAMTLTLVFSGILGKLILLQKLPQENTGNAVMAALIGISFAAALLASWKIRHRRLLVCILSGLIYWGLLLCVTALFFGGQYAAIWETGFLINIGSAAAALCSLKSGPVGRRRRRHAA